MSTTTKGTRSGELSSAPTLSLYSTAEATAAALRAALASPRVPLATARPDERPGVYVLFARRTTPALRRYGPVITDGAFPLYIGSAQLLPRRLNRHRQTVASARGLKVDDLAVLFIYTDSLAAALAIEALLIREIRPPWNERSLSGFGSAPQTGERRPRASGFDCLHPRSWARPASRDEVATARAALRLYLASGYVRALWPAL